MPFDKVVDSAKLDAEMAATAAAIRAKTGKTDTIPWEDQTGFAGELNALVSVEQATPSISVSSGGLITASAEQAGGIVPAGTKSATQQLSTQAAKTVTPSTSNQTAVAKGKYTTGAVTVKGDANLKAANILKGVSIFGVSGSLELPKIARGTVTIGNYGILNGTVTVSGLGFKPSFIIMYVSPDIVNNWEQYENYAPWDGVALYTIYADGETQTVCPEMGEEPNYDEETGEEWTYEYVSAYVAGNLGITPTNDGFTIAAVNSIALWEHPAQYIAIG